VSFLNYQKRLLIALLEDEETKGSAGSDLREVAKSAGLDASDENLVRFINEGSIFGSGVAVQDSYGFTLNANGLSYAAEYRDELRKKTVFDRLKSVTRSDWIAFGALVISTIALFKD